MRRPLTEALRPPTSATARSGQQGGVAEDGDHRRGVVEPGKQRRVVRRRPAASSRAPSLAVRSSSRDRIRLGRHGGRVGLAAGAGEPGQRLERGGGGAEACEQAAVGDRADALGAGQAQAVDRVSGVARTGVVCLGTGGLLLPPALVPRGPVLRLAADARLGAGEQAADVGVVADEHQHGDRQRKLNDAGIG